MSVSGHPDKTVMHGPDLHDHILQRDIEKHSNLQTAFALGIHSHRFTKKIAGNLFRFRPILPPIHGLASGTVDRDTDPAGCPTVSAPETFQILAGRGVPPGGPADRTSLGQGSPPALPYVPALKTQTVGEMHHFRILAEHHPTAWTFADLIGWFALHRITSGICRLRVIKLA